MKPIIGIIGRVEEVDDNVRIIVTDAIRRMIIRYGGIPILILPVQNIDYYHTLGSDVLPMTNKEKEMLNTQLALCDGLILPGGSRMYEYDNYALEYAMKKDIPILGICLGMQIMWNYSKKAKNIKNDTSIQHYSDDPFAHSIILLSSSFLARICNSTKFYVNSKHNYHIDEKEKSNYYKIVGLSEDGLPEAIECSMNRFNVGVQWHPELLSCDNIISKQIFTTFISYCTKHYDD